MKSKKKSWLVLIVVVLMIAACSYVSAYGYGKDHIGTAKNIKLGLDLAGGVNITYEADEDNPSAEDMNDTVYKLQQSRGMEYRSRSLSGRYKPCQR